MLVRVVSLIIGYICGNFLTGYLYAKSKNVDIRTVGSGNVGTTNTYRSLGYKAGILTLLGDVLKVVVAVLLVWLLFHNNYEGSVKVLQYYAALGCILGHNFPFVMKFHGGKGIACTAGLVVAVCPMCVPVCLFIFVGTVAITRYVSLGSILVCISLLVQTVLFGQMGLLGVSGNDLLEIYGVITVVMLLGVLRHHENIGRLLKGTENKFSLKKKEGKENQNHA